jgi:TolB protein
MIRLLAFVFLSWVGAAHAQLSIEITGAGAQRIPIAIAPFAGENALPPGVSTIVRADLERSGLFRGL